MFWPLFITWAVVACMLAGWLGFVLVMDWQSERIRWRPMIVEVCGAVVVCVFWPALLVVCLWGWFKEWRREPR